MKRRTKGLAVLAGAAAVTIAALTGALAYAGPQAAVAPAADVNLSRNHPVVASSSGGCCAPKNAVDGNSTTRWASGANIDPSWIYVDLGTTAAVHRVRLQWDLSCATAYRVELSTDHVNWNPVFTESSGNGGVDDLTTINGSGRYVRMFGTHRCRSDATHGYSLQEFDVFGTTSTMSAPGMPVQDSITPTSVTIHWAPSTGPVAFYDIFKDGQLCGTVQAPTTSGTCTGLSPKFDFGIYLDARDSAGNVSDPSPKLIVHTPGTGDDEKPTAPSNVHVNGTVTSTTIPLAWTASTDNVGVTSYTVYNVVGSTRTVVGGSADATASTRLDGLTPGTTYHLQVTASDFNKNESDGSTPLLDVSTPGQTTCTPPQEVCAAKQVGTDDDVVWGLVTLPDGTLLYNQRDVHAIVHLNPKTGAKKTIGTVPNVQSTNGEGGLTGLEIAPSFSSDHWLYIMHTSPSDNRIVRIKYDPVGDTLQTSTEQILLTGIKRNTFHDGGRLRWGPDGKLYATTGDAQSGANAQNLNSLNGKILRLNPDGSVPSDNPFAGKYVWSYGHRNPQGIDFDSQGRLWEQEFGNSAQDETNLIRKGGNYGWPACEGTISQSGGGCGTPGFIAPVHTYAVANGSCSGLTVIRDVLYIACERGMRLYREVISGNGVTHVEQFFVKTFGRLRTVEPAPDGGMWMATSNGGDKDSVPHNSNNRIFHVDLSAS